MIGYREAIRQQAAALASARRTTAERQAMIDSLHEELLGNEKYSALIELQEGMTACRKRENEEKEELSGLMVEGYIATGDKKTPYGSVALRKKVVYDEGEAVAWCISSGMQALLTVKASEFKKAAEGLADALDFIVIEEEPFARVSSSWEEE